MPTELRGTIALGPQFVSGTFDVRASMVIASIDRLFLNHSYRLGLGFCITLACTMRARRPDYIEFAH